MPDTHDLIRARYVLSILSVARRADRDSAVPLLESLLTERPHLETGAEIAKTQQAAISAVDTLLSGVRDG